MNFTADATDTEGAAEMIGLAPSTLNTWRSRGTGPEYFRVGGRIRYLRSDITAWLNEQRQKTAS